VSLTDETLILDDGSNEFVATTFQDAEDYRENYDRRSCLAEGPWYEGHASIPEEAFEQAVIKWNRRAS